MVISLLRQSRRILAGPLIASGLWSWGAPALAAPENDIPADLQTAVSQTLGTYGFPQKIAAQTAEGGDDAQKSAEFGFRIALSADGNTALIPALGAEVNGLAAAGAVYVYTRTDSGWAMQQKLTAQNSDGSDDTQKGATFGYGIALAADGETALVGAISKVVSGQVDAGAAYVYRRNGSVWQIEQKLTAQKSGGADDVSTSAIFGVAVTLTEDGNTAAVGAFGAPVDGASGQIRAGAAYLYRRTGTAWQIQQKVTAQNSDGTSDAVNGADFGLAVALSADGSTLLAGARNRDFGAGAAYVYGATDTGWNIQRKLTAQTSRGKDDAEAGAEFGGAVALSAGGDTALIGAGQATASGQPRAGAAYVYQRKGSKWNIQQKLAAQNRNGKSDAAEGALFGSSALTADGDTALIGATFATADDLKGAGAAYLYHRDGKRWHIQQKLAAQTQSGTSDAEANAHFGKIALSAGGGTAFIGAYDATVSGLTNAGAVYAYDSAYRLTVTANSGGTVTSLPAGIDCGTTCQSGFAKGTAVTLSAVPAEGYRFKGWSGGGCSGKQPCTVKINKSKTVKATFVPQQ